MGLFRKSDELFELMSKSGSRPGSGSTSDSGSRANPSQSRSGSGGRPFASGFGPPFETTKGFGRSNLFGRAKTGPDLFEVDGEALVIVEDGFDLETAAAEGKGFSIRPDTLIVGGLLATGLLISAFLLGRTSGDETPKVATIVVNESAEDMTEKAQEPAPVAIQPPARSTEPTAQGPVIQPPATGAQAIQPPARQETAQRPARGATTVAASAKVAPGRYELIVASTTPASAKKLADWFKKNALSPIYGRSDLEVIASRKGRVSIKGFQKTEGTVLKRVRATQDPLGGSGSFSDAYFKRARR
jgi:hypothetical protein